MIIEDPETKEIYGSDVFKYRLEADWIDYKNTLRELGLLIYMNKILIKELGINEDDYPMEWD